MVGRRGPDHVRRHLQVQEQRLGCLTLVLVDADEDLQPELTQKDDVHFLADSGEETVQ